MQEQLTQSEDPLLLATSGWYGGRHSSLQENVSQRLWAHKEFKEAAQFTRGRLVNYTATSAAAREAKVGLERNAPNADARASETLPTNYR